MDMPAKRTQLKAMVEKLAAEMPVSDDGSTIWGGFDKERVFVDTHARGAVFVAQDSLNTVLIRRDSQGRLSYRAVDCIDLLACEIAGGGQVQTITRTVTVAKKRPSVAGAVIGGLIAGPAGGVVGGLGFGSSESHGESRSIQRVSPESNRAGTTVVISINDPATPSFSVDQLIPEFAGQLYAELVVAVEMGKTRRQELEVGAPTLGVADEITRLATLKEQGHITADEFNRQKAILLRIPSAARVESSRTTPWLLADQAIAWTGSQRLPDVVGKNLPQAIETMRSAGYYLFKYEDSTGKGLKPLCVRKWKVLAQSPEPGTGLDTDRVVTFRVKRVDR